MSRSHSWHSAIAHMTEKHIVAISIFIGFVLIAAITLMNGRGGRELTGALCSSCMNSPPEQQQACMQTCTPDSSPSSSSAMSSSFSPMMSSSVGMSSSVPATCEDIIACPGKCSDTMDNDGANGTDAADPKCFPITDPRCERKECLSHCSNTFNDDGWGGTDAYDVKCL